MGKIEESSVLHYEISHFHTLTCRDVILCMYNVKINGGTSLTEIEIDFMHF